MRDWTIKSSHKDGASSFRDGGRRTSCLLMLDKCVFLMVTFRWIVTSRYALTHLPFNVPEDTFHSDCRNHYVNLVMFCIAYFKRSVFPSLLKI